MATDGETSIFTTKGARDIINQRQKSHAILMFLGKITIFLWFPYRFPMVFPWFSHGFPMGFTWFPNSVSPGVVGDISTGITGPWQIRQATSAAKEFLSKALR